MRQENASRPQLLLFASSVRKTGGDKLLITQLADRVRKFCLLLRVTFCSLHW